MSARRSSEQKPSKFETATATFTGYTSRSKKNIHFGVNFKQQKLELRETHFGSQRKLLEKYEKINKWLHNNRYKVWGSHSLQGLTAEITYTWEPCFTIAKATLSPEAERSVKAHIEGARAGYKAAKRQARAIESAKQTNK